MPHLEHDRLVFLALGESEADPAETDHLRSCDSCRSELETLRQIVAVGSGTQALHELPPPPPQVWQGIVAQIAAAGSGPTNVPALPAPVSPATAGRPAFRPAPVRPIAGAARTRRNWSRWASMAVTAAAAVVVGVVGTLVAVGWPTDRGGPPEPEVVASAPLAAYGSTPASASGAARVFTDGRLHLHVTGLPPVPGYYEVWLINPSNLEMFSVGTLGVGPDALLPLPPNVDLATYSLVDVSAEQYDNDTAHSGDSLLRGTLTR